MLQAWTLPLALCLAQESSVDGLALRDVCHPALFSGLDAGLPSKAVEAPGAGWIALERALAAARVIGLGEATHGTSEFLVAKHAFIRRLVTDHAATALVLEISVGEQAAEFDRGIGDCRVDAG